MSPLEAPPFLTVDAEVQRLRDDPRTPPVQLAWALRQRDTRTALTLVQGADGGDPWAGLVRAEAAWLFNRPADALAHLQEAEACFRAAGNACGLGDAALCRTLLADEYGGDVDAPAAEALACYRAAGDRQRADLCEAWLACVDVMREPELLGRRFAERLARDGGRHELGVATYLHNVEGMLAWSRGDVALAIVAFQRAFDDASATGQLRSAITLAQNLAIAYSSIHQHESALAWATRASDLVQPTGWPYVTAWTLTQGASVLVGLGEARLALQWLQHAKPLLAGHEGTRNHVLACTITGEALLALQRPDEALQPLAMALAHAGALGGADLVCGALRHQALALSGLGRLTEALQAIDQARQLATAQGQWRQLAEVEHMAARVAAEHALAAPPGSAFANGAIHHLRQALAAAMQVTGFQVPPEWHQALSGALEAAGDMGGALGSERDASRARESLHTRRSEVMAQVLRVRHETERARADAAQARAEARSLALQAELAESRAQLERERHQAQLAHAGKLVAMGRLMAGTVHEMGHPVGTLSLLSESLLAAHGDGAAPLKQALQTMQGEARRLRRFVERLRSFARAEPLQCSPQSLATVLARARAVYAPRMALDRIAVEQQGDDCLVHVDEDRLALVLANLAFNAADAMQGRREPRLLLRIEPGETEVALHVADNGPGLSEQGLARLFEPFYTTKPDGLGLGLSLSAESVAAMGGRLEACNLEAGGACFTVRLRRAL